MEAQAIITQGRPFEAGPVRLLRAGRRLCRHGNEDGAKHCAMNIRYSLQNAASQKLYNLVCRVTET